MDKATQEKLLANVKNLNEKFRGNLAKRLADIKHNWELAQQHPEDDAIQKEAYRTLHSLAGSAGTFGFPEIGHSARNLLNAIKDWQAEKGAPNEQLLQLIAERFAEFEQLVEKTLK